MKKMSLYLLAVIATQIIAEALQADRTWAVGLGWIGAVIWCHFEKSVPQRSDQP